ncbi:MAG: hypothetical protein ACRC0S_07545 [Fusobacteriaceae bacterium]
MGVRKEYLANGKLKSFRYTKKFFKTLGKIAKDIQEDVDYKLEMERTYN